MFGLDDVLGGLTAVQGIVGAFGAQARAKQAQEYRAQLLTQRAQQLNQERNDLMTGNLTALRRSAGNLGDLLQGRAANVGAASAAAGVFNSTATQSAIDQQASENAATLQQLSGQNFATEQSQLHQGQQELSQQQLGVANEDYANARQDQAAAYGSLNAGLGALTKLDSDRRMAADRNKQNGRIDNLMAQNQSLLQSAIQPMTGQSPGVQGISSRNNGLMLNGNQGFKLPLSTPGIAGPVQTGSLEGLSNLLATRKLVP